MEYSYPNSTGNFIQNSEEKHGRMKLQNTTTTVVEVL